MKSSLEEEKWGKFLKAVRLFRLVPFADFVMASGSLVTGALRESSDFDVLVGAREGRILTNRFFAVLVLGLTRNWKHKMHERGVAKDMMCLNHFVTPKAYKLRPPYTEYDREVYSKLVFVVGNEEKAREFFEANDWLKIKEPHRRDSWYLGDKKSVVRKVLELFLGGKFGDLFEKWMSFQTRKIREGLPAKMPEGARFVCSEHELEFHIYSADTIRKWEDRKRG